MNQMFKRMIHIFGRITLFASSYLGTNLITGPEQSICASPRSISALISALPSGAVYAYINLSTLHVCSLL